MVICEEDFVLNGTQEINSVHFNLLHVSRTFSFDGQSSVVSGNVGGVK